MLLNTAEAAADHATATSLPARLSACSEDIVDEIVTGYQDEIQAYRELSDDTLVGDVAAVSLNDLRAVLRSAERDGALDDAALESIRCTAARRAHQGVPLDSLLRAYLVSARVTWNAARRAAALGMPMDSEAATTIGDVLFRRADAASRIAVDTYRCEMHSTSRRPARDLFDALVSGRLIRVPESGELADDYAVVVARPTAPATGESPSGERIRLLRTLDTMQLRLQPPGGGLLTGIRDGDVIALIPVPDRDELQRVALNCDAIVRALKDDRMVLGVSAWRPGHAGVAAALRDARSAVEVADRLGRRGGAVRFDDIVLEHIIHTGDDADGLLEEVLAGLRAYDDARRGNLLETLRAYIASEMKVQRAAANLHIHANTLSYRLRRIAEITGRDPTRLEDLLVLALALKAERLNTSPRPPAHLPSQNAASARRPAPRG